MISVCLIILLFLAYSTCSEGLWPVVWHEAQILFHRQGLWWQSWCLLLSSIILLLRSFKNNGLIGHVQPWLVRHTFRASFLYERWQLVKIGISNDNGLPYLSPLFLFFSAPSRPTHFRREKLASHDWSFSLILSRLVERRLLNWALKVGLEVLLDETGFLLGEKLLCARCLHWHVLVDGAVSPRFLGD